MQQLLRRRPSAAMAVALLALFVALGGSSYAALHVGSAQIVNNSVRSKDIRNNDVRSKDIRNNDIRGKDIRNSTIQGKDVALDTLTGLDVKESTLGKVPPAGTADSAARARVAVTTVAYARADSSGDVVEADSRGVGDRTVSTDGSRHTAC